MFCNKLLIVCQLPPCATSPDIPYCLCPLCSILHHSSTIFSPRSKCVYLETELKNFIVRAILIRVFKIHAFRYWRKKYILEVRRIIDLEGHSTY